MANKTLSILQKIKAGAMVFVGFMLPVNIIHEYITKGDLDHIPRILFPVYSIIGALGTTIATCVLGAIIIWMGIKQWKEASAKIASDV